MYSTRFFCNTIVGKICLLDINSLIAGTRMVLEGDCHVFMLLKKCCKLILND